MAESIGEDAGHMPAGRLPPRAQVLFHAGRCDEALAVWRASPAVQDVPAALRAACALTRHGWAAAAAALLNAIASRTGGGAAEAVLPLAATWLEMGATDRAAELFQSFVAADPGCSAAWLGLAATHPVDVPLDRIWAGTPAAADPLIRALLDGSAESVVEDIVAGAQPSGCLAPGLYWRLGWRVTAARGYAAAARACLRRAAAAAPDDLMTAYDFAGACLRAGRVGDIAAVWSALPDELADPTPSRLVAATIALNDDKVVKALDLARSVLELDDRRWAAAHGVAHSIAGYALTMMARDATIRGRLARFMARGSRRAASPDGLDPAGAAASLAAQARDHLATVIAGDGTAEAWNDMGHLCASLDELADADAAFSRALTIDPTQRNATINLGVIQLRQDRRADLTVHLRDTLFLSDLPPSLKHFKAKSAELPVDTNEWRRGTVFSYAWRRVLAEMLAGEGTP